MRKPEIKTEKNILKDIKNGVYRNQYLIYNRKSTDEVDNQKNSISYQKSENTRFAFREKFSIAPITIKSFCVDGMVSEKHSGFKEDDDIFITDDGLVQYRIERPKFQQLLQHVSRGYFKGIICLCWDRISRNKGDDAVIRKLMRKGIDIRFAYAHYGKTSAGALHMDIDGMFSQHHSRVTSEKVILSIRNAREKGFCTYRASIGYLNEGQIEHKPLDPVRAPIIKEMYERYATGDWSLTDLAGYAKEHGLVTVPMRRRRTKEEMLAEDDEVVEIPQVSRLLTQNRISVMLSNPFYTGKIVSTEGRYIKSNCHEALVSEELFNEVQRVLKKKQVSIHYTEKLDLPLRGIIRCSDCQRVYTPYTKKGIQYYNARCVKGCKNRIKNFNFSYIEKEISKLISTLHFTDEELAEMDGRIKTDMSLLYEKRNKTLESLERKKKKIREDLNYIFVNKLSLLKSGVYTPENLLKEEEKLNSQLSQLKSTEDISDEAMHETMKDVIKLSELLKDVVPHYNSAVPHEKERVIRTIFSELVNIANNIATSAEELCLIIDNLSEQKAAA